MVRFLLQTPQTRKMRLQSVRALSTSAKPSAKPSNPNFGKGLSLHLGNLAANEKQAVDPARSDLVGPSMR